MGGAGGPIAGAGVAGMNAISHKNVARAAGAMVGIGLALALLVLARPGAAGSPLAAGVRVAVEPSGELEIVPVPPRPALVAEGLRPGGPEATGGFAVRNQTGSALAVALTAQADSTALDGLLRVQVRAVGRLLADGTLESLRKRPPRLRLASGQRARLSLRVWLPPDVFSGYEGVLVEASLVPRVRVLGGRG